MTCPGRGICTTLEALTGHGVVTISRREGRYRVSWQTREDERWDAEGDTCYDAVEAAVAKWCEQERITEARALP